jgi:alkylhydroperoxidase family enzyme
MGITEEMLAELGRYETSPHFTPVERLALALADAMTATPSTVDDELRARLREHLSDAQLTELAAAIAWENHRARLNRALDVRAAGFSDGAYCLLPHGPNRLR